jgi:hypothetical protein
LREEVAEGYHVKVVSGKIPIPDLRVEYVNENDNQIQHCDLELATDHYRPQGLSQKARAGFQIYARSGETDRLRRIRDDRELITANRRSTQFDARKNTASSRQHAPRLAVGSHSNAICIEEVNSDLTEAPLRPTL